MGLDNFNPVNGVSAAAAAAPVQQPDAISHFETTARVHAYTAIAFNRVVAGGNFEQAFRVSLRDLVSEIRYAIELAFENNREEILQADCERLIGPLADYLDQDGEAYGSRNRVVDAIVSLFPNFPDALREIAELRAASLVPYMRAEYRPAAALAAAAASFERQYASYNLSWAQILVIASKAYCQITGEELPTVLDRLLVQQGDKDAIETCLQANYNALIEMNCESAVPAIRSFLALDPLDIETRDAAARAIRHLVPSIEPNSLIEASVSHRAMCVLADLWDLNQASPRPS